MITKKHVFSTIKLMDKYNGVHISIKNTGLFGIRRGETVMSKTRPELSDKNKYYISKHRYYELKHFVQQYPEWVEKLKDISSLAKVTPTDSDKIQKGSVSDPTCDAVEKGLLYSLNMQIVDQSAKETDPVIGTIIMLNVISGDSYDSGVANVPCCREVYYELYRKFFYILDRKRK